MLPYYNVPPATADETMEIVVKSSTFLDKARTALQYYGMEGMIRSGEDDSRGVYDALYLLGLPKEAFVTQRIYSTGSQSQENDAHLMEWLAVRCTAQFFRTAFRGADAHNIDCYYYQWHNREVSWDCFDNESALYRNSFGGLIKSSALFFAECYPTLRTCIQEDSRRQARTVNYWTAFFYDVRRFSGAQRAELEKLIDSLYKLLAFYANWMWQVLRTLPPTLRPEKAAEADARELAESYHRLIDIRASLGNADGASVPAAGTAANDAAQALRADYTHLNARINALVAALGGSTYLAALHGEKSHRADRLETQRQALAEQEERIALWEGEDSRLIDPQALRAEQGRRDAMRRAYAGMSERLALVEEDEVRAVEARLADQPAAIPADELPQNDLFRPELLSALHRLLTLYGTAEEIRDQRSTDALRRALWDNLQRLVAQRVPDRITATQAVAGMGGGSRIGEGPQAAFASFTAALLATVVEEENV